ncbi:MAG: PAS domain S-box protein [Theionarchaea archaeon]|nr:PAS domain S-box protein [Theionarchaea archaeon]
MKVNINRKKVEKEEERVLHDLRERVKELQCIYAIDEIVREDVAIEKILNEIVRVIPASWQYPDVTQCLITLEDETVKTDNFTKTPWMQSEPITVLGNQVGHIQVSYTQEKSLEDEGPFLREERELLNSIAKRLGGFIERGRIQEALNESKICYKTFFESIPVGVSIVNLDGAIVANNTRMSEITGYSQKELDTIGVPETFENKEEYSHLLNQMQKKGFIRGYGVKLKRKDSTSFFAKLTMAKGFIKGEEVYLLIIRDTETEKTEELRESQEALQKSEEEFRLSFENAKDAIFWAEPDGTIIRCNKAAESLLQKNRESIIGHHQLELHPQEEYDYYSAVFKRHKKENIIEDIEAEVQTASGERIPVHISESLMVVGGKPIVQGIFRDITKMKQAEKALKESEKRYRAVVEDQTELICRFLPDLTLNFVNEAYCRYFGKSQKDLLGKQFTFLIPEEDREKDLNHLASLTYENPSGTVEHRVIAPGGEIRWLQWTNRALFNKHKDLTEFQAVGRDITERKQSEERLRYQADLLESVSDAIISTDLDLIIKTWNKAAEIMYGWNSEEVIGKSTEEILETGVSSGQVDIFGQGLFEIGHWEGETTQKKKDGTLIHVLASVSLIKDDTGNYVGTVAVNRDITDKREAEKALQKSERKYQQLIESLHEGIWVIDEDAYTIFVNTRMAEMLGYTVEEMVGIHLFSFMDKEGVAVCKRYIERRKQGIQEQHDFEFLRKDGTPLYAAIETSPIIDDEGRFKGAIAGVMNITERKKAERKLQWELDVNTALSKLYSPLISPSSLEEIAEIILEQAKHLTESEHGYVASIDPDTGACIAHTLTEMLADQCSVPPEKRGIVFFPREDRSYPGLWGYSLNNRKPFFTNTPEDYPGFGSIPKGHISVETFLSVPVMLGEEVAGQIALANKKSGFTTQDLEAICRFAEVYALAIERLRIEEKLQESEEKFRGIAERNFDAIFELDEEGYFTYVSPAIKRITGYTPEEMLGKPFTTYVEEPDIQRSYEAFNYVLKGETLEGFQIEVTKKDGSLAFTEINTSPIFKEGIVTATQGVVRDITERKKAEEGLLESEEKYRTLVEQSLQGILIIQGIPLCIVFANPAMAEITGYTIEELLSLAPEDITGIVHPEDQLVFERYLARLEGKAITPRYEFRIIRRDGSVCWLEIHASRIEYQGASAVQAAFINITERRKAEEQIKASLREKEVLLREIHHRVKNNLQVISSLLNLQASHSKDSQYEILLKDSQYRIRTMALIHEMLYQSENLAEINFEEYITSLVTGLVRSYNAADKVALSVEVGDIPMGIDAAIPCGLIINELVSNALKHAFPDRNGEIVISLQVTDGRAQLIVADNGIGISDTIDFRATDTLGLDLVISLAEEQLEGTITLDKTKGTAFTIIFDVM